MSDIGVLNCFFSGIFLCDERSLHCAFYYPLHFQDLLQTRSVFPHFPLFVFRCSFMKEFQIMLNRPVKAFLGRPRFVWVADTATILKEGYCEG